MQMQELLKNALIDAGIVDYAVDTVDAEMLLQGELAAAQSINALNCDPALSFGLIAIELEGVKTRDIHFPLLGLLGSERREALREAKT